MRRNEHYWLLLGAVVATGLVTAFLAVASLNPYQNPSTGDILAAPAIANSLTLAILLVGSIVLLGLELARETRRRRGRAGRAQVVGRREPLTIPQPWPTLPDRGPHPQTVDTR